MVPARSSKQTQIRVTKTKFDGVAFNIPVNKDDEEEFEPRGKGTISEIGEVQRVLRPRIKKRGVRTKVCSSIWHCLSAES